MQTGRRQAHRGHNGETIELREVTISFIFPTLGPLMTDWLESLCKEYTEIPER